MIESERQKLINRLMPASRPGPSVMDGPVDAAWVETNPGMVAEYIRKLEASIEQQEAEIAHLSKFYGEKIEMYRENSRLGEVELDAVRESRDAAVRAFDTHECEAVARGALDAQADAEKRLFEAKQEIEALTRGLRALIEPW